MTPVKGLAEIVIWVNDMDKALNFYRDVLGLQVMARPDQRGAVFLQAGPAVINVPQQVVLVPLPDGAEGAPQEKPRRALHHIGLEISGDLESEAARLQGLGYEVRRGEHPFLPLRGLYIDDPDGNEVELIAAIR